ncbi:MAG: UDP-2,3-diacylglucosamine diphosphatase [Gammaproteobacteria bacterium]|nr:UDP-2,3-diacylglucosamine diphosphatase [Gammaproteobacteria bacterium]
MTTLFISDLHLEGERPDVSDQFLEFLKTEGRDAEALYILGNLFEAWVGDDDPNTHYHMIKMALRKLVDHSVPVYFIHGDRDFMIGRQFANETGVKILEDPCRITLYGRRALLSHGDLLCTGDAKLHSIRKMTRNADFKASMLAKPLKERIRIAQESRRQSLEQTINQSLNIPDVNEDAVKQALTKHRAEVLLHGHTHRPGVHTVDLGGRKATRIVLGDWYLQGSVVRWDMRGPKLEELPRRR